MSEKITTRELDRITRWIAERTKGRCPFCDGREWSVDDELASLPAFQHATPQVQLDRGYTFVLLTCEGCGYTASFAAKRVMEAAAG